MVSGFLIALPAGLARLARFVGAHRRGHRLLEAGDGVTDHVFLARVEARAHCVMDKLLKLF